MNPAITLPWEWRLTVLATKGSAPPPLRLEVNDPIEFGRLAPLAIEDPELSRRHGRITLLEGDEVLVEDLGSRNGTRVEGRRLRASGWAHGPDVVLVAGGTVIHVGKALAVRGDPSDLDDAALVAVAARVAATPGPVLATTSSGRFGERLARRILGDGGTLWALAGVDGSALEDAIEAAPAGCWLLLTEPRHPRLGELIDRATALGRHVVVLSDHPTEAQVRAVGEAAVVVVPPLGERRGELYRRLRAGLLRAGCHRSFRPTALHRLLVAGWDERLFELRLERLVRQSRALPRAEELTSDHVRAALRAPAPGELPRRRPLTPVDMNEVKRELEAGSSVADVAERHARSRKQVYRWLDALGISAPSTRGLRSTSEPTR